MNISTRDRTDTLHAGVVGLDFERRGIFGRIALYFARRRADALLRRTLRPYRRGSAAQLTPHLLKDIGLPPDFRM